MSDKTRNAFPTEPAELDAASGLRACEIRKDLCTNRVGVDFILTIGPYDEYLCCAEFAKGELQQE